MIILYLLYLIWLGLGLGCPGRLMSLYGPTFHVSAVDLCIIFQCNIYNPVYIRGASMKKSKVGTMKRECRGPIPT